MAVAPSVPPDGSSPSDEEPNAASQVVLAPFTAVGEVLIFWLNAFLGVMTFLGDFLVVIGKTIGFILRGAISVPLTISQMAFLGVDSMGIVLVCIGFTGTTLGQVLMSQVESIGYGKDLIGGGMLWVMSKELGPVLSGLILAGRAGAGIASEIGTMKVTEQVDALRATGVHPIRYLSVPRVLAAIIMTPLVCFGSVIVGVVSGYIYPHYGSVLHLSFAEYFDSVRSFWDWDLMQALVQKSLVFGAIVAGVAVTEGFNTTGGAEGVGRTTTRAVVNAMILIFLADMVMTIVFHV